MNQKIIFILFLCEFCRRKKQGLWWFYLSITRLNLRCLWCLFCSCYFITLCCCFNFILSSFCQQKNSNFLLKKIMKVFWLIFSKNEILRNNFFASRLDPHKYLNRTFKKLSSKFQENIYPASKKYSMKKLKNLFYIWENLELQEDHFDLIPAKNMKEILFYS